MDWKLELVLIPVTKVDRAKAFYTEQLGFSLDVDHDMGDHFRVVQMTPPGSSCSIAVGIGITDAQPGSIRGLHLVVPDIAAACKQLDAQRVKTDPIRHMTETGWVDGVDPKHADYNTFSGFSDPDGNTWVLQERGHTG